MKTIFSNTLSACILLLLFFLAFTWIIFDFNGSSESLKDSLTIVSSIFGGVATLVAAYIASRLFNDWKFQHNKEVNNIFGLRVLEQFETFCEEISAYRTALTNFTSKEFNFALGMELGLEEIEKQIDHDKNGIVQKIESIEIAYDDLIRKLKLYARATNNMDQIQSRIGSYQGKLTEISDGRLRTYDWLEFKIACDALAIGYLDLKNMIETGDCFNIIDSLKAK